MGDFNRGGRGGGSRGGFGGGGNRGGYGGGGRGDRQMHHATCAKCGNDCEVPFRPTGEKPVYCSSCFERPAGNDRRSYDRAPSRSATPNMQPQFDALHKKLDLLISLLTEEDQIVEEIDVATEADNTAEVEPNIEETENVIDELEL